MPEQLTFRHTFRQCGTVEIDQRIHRPWRGFMNRFRHQLLTGSRLTADQDVEIGRRHNLNLFSVASCQGQANHLRLFHRFKRRGIARHHILAFQLFNQQRIA